MNRSTTSCNGTPFFVNTLYMPGDENDSCLRPREVILLSEASIVSSVGSFVSVATKPSSTDLSRHPFGQRYFGRPNASVARVAMCSTLEKSQSKRGPIAAAIIRRTDDYCCFPPVRYDTMGGITGNKNEQASRTFCDCQAETIDDANAHKMAFAHRFVNKVLR
eukprot:scaffold190109_cov15-Prasinocladus_malaysianus.AAC.1